MCLSCWALGFVALKFRFLLTFGVITAHLGRDPAGPVCCRGEEANSPPGDTRVVSSNSQIKQTASAAIFTSRSARVIDNLGSEKLLDD